MSSWHCKPALFVAVTGIHSHKPPPLPTLTLTTSFPSLPKVFGRVLEGYRECGGHEPLQHWHQPTNTAAASRVGHPHHLLAQLGVP